MPFKIVNQLLKVVSLDPGITTGHASGVITDGKMGVVSGQDVWNEYELYTQLKFVKPNVIICEKFDFRNVKKSRDRVELFPRNLVGVVHLYVQECEANDVPVEFYEQTPAQVMGFFTDRRLKEEHLYKVAHEHANDAMRHILHWFMFGAGFKYNTGGYESLA
jgi:hypothetical protein